MSSRKYIVTLLFFLVAQILHGQLPIDRVAGVDYQVRDLAKARAFYGGTLGLEAFDIIDADGKITSAFFKINDDQYVEFSVVPDGPEFLFISASFLTHDLKRLAAGLRKLGISPDMPAIGSDGNSYIQVKDPMGNRLRFFQYRKGSLQVEHRGRDSTSGKLSSHLLHVGFAEDDETAALVFYQNKLGFHEFLSGGPTAGYPNWFNMRMPVPSDDYIELMVDTSNPASRRDHISLEVQDIHRAHDLLVNRGISGHNPVVAQNHRWIINLSDPYGIRVEIMGEVTTEPVLHPPK